MATIAHEYRRLLEAYADLTGADAAFIDWQAHDFSARGLSGPEDSMRAGFAHLCSFTGTDTVAAIDYAEQYYGADSDRELVGGSVPATEHSVMSMGGKLDEIGTFRRLITEVYPSGIVSIVSDTWDFWQVITEYAATLKDEILARAPNALGQAKVVFRPDSGDPVKILTGYLPDELAGDADADGMYTVKDTGGRITEAERKGAVECLWDLFGGDLTAKGFRVLHPRVGLIYGDSITLSRAERILERLRIKGYASTNCVFGVGSYSYQYLTRDSFGMAMKATWGMVNGEARELSRIPRPTAAPRSRRWACCASSSARATTTCCMIARRPSRRPAACCKTCSSTASWCASTRWPRSAPACATAAERRRAPWRRPLAGRRATLSLVENKPVILARRDIRANRGGGIGACGSVPRPLQSSGMTKTATAHERPILTVDVALLALIDQRLHVALAPRARRPFKGQLALPGGYVRVDADADTDQTARRVLREAGLRAGPSGAGLHRVRPRARSARLVRVGGVPGAACRRRAATAGGRRPHHAARYRGAAGAGVRPQPPDRAGRASAREVGLYVHRRASAARRIHHSPGPGGLRGRDRASHECRQLPPQDPGNGRAQETRIVPAAYRPAQAYRLAEPLTDFGQNLAR